MIKNDLYELKISEKLNQQQKFTIKKNQQYISFSQLIYLTISCLIILIKILKQDTHNKLETNTSVLIIFIILINGFFLIIKGFSIVKESLIVIKDIGIQLEQKKLNGSKMVQFYDLADIRDTIIHEGLTPFDVRYYLAIILKDSNILILPFQNFDLSFLTIQQIFYPARMLLKQDTNSRKYSIAVI